MGALLIKSRTSVANSCANEATMWSNLVFWTVIPRVINCASTWANQTSGSAGQNGGSLRCTAATALSVSHGCSFSIVTDRFRHQSHQLVVYISTAMIKLLIVQQSYIVYRNNSYCVFTYLLRNYCVELYEFCLLTCLLQTRFILPT